ncbi:MAG: hypothetical protein ABIP51_11730 [Bacteroidia bacterium]
MKNLVKFFSKTKNRVRLMIPFAIIYILGLFLPIFYNSERSYILIITTISSILFLGSTIFLFIIDLKASNIETKIMEKENLSEHEKNIKRWAKEDLNYKFEKFYDEQ